MIEEDIEWFIERFGEADSAKAVEQATLNKYCGKLPDALLQFWQDYGFCSFKKGLISFVNPEEYDHLIQVWIKDEEVLASDNYYVIAKSGFGELFVWGEKSGRIFDINAAFSWVIRRKGNTEFISSGKDYEAVGLFLDGLKIKFLEMECEKGEPMFERALEKLGELSPDEIYGFEPALSLGGKALVENLNKVNVHVHLSLLAELSPPEILSQKDLIKKAF